MNAFKLYIYKEKTHSKLKNHSFLTMSDLVSIYYTKKLFLCNLYAKDYLPKLHDAIVSNLPMRAFQFSKYIRNNHAEFNEQFDPLDLAEQEVLIAKIIKYLEVNKFKLSKQRKIEIFSTWFSWLAISNSEIQPFYENFIHLDESIELTNALLENKKRIENYSFRFVHEIAKSVLFEVNSLSCCYKLEFTAHDPKKYCINEYDSIYEYMWIQPNILTRAICSQSAKNVNLLLDNGLNFIDYEFNHPLLKTPLHWAFYCDNLVIFDLLIQNGCRFNENDIFYDSNCKKNFKFGLYLHFLKEKNFKILDKLRFDEQTYFMSSFQLYEYYKTDEEVIGLFDSLYSIGFDLNVVHAIHENLGNQETFNFAEYHTQFLACVNQNGIKQSIIEYLVKKLLDKYSLYDPIIQNELVSTLRIITNLFYEHMLYYQRRKLKRNDFVHVVSAILPILNERSLNLYKSSIQDIKKEFYDLLIDCITSTCEKEYNGENNSNQAKFNVFNMNSFKIIDIFINYGLFTKEDINLIFTSLCYSDYSSKCKVIIVPLFLEYLIINNFVERDFYQSSIRFVHRGRSWSFDDGLPKALNKIYNNQKKLNSLFCMTKKTIRKSMRVITDDSLMSLNLPRPFLVLIKTTIKP